MAGFVTPTESSACNREIRPTSANDSWSSFLSCCEEDAPFGEQARRTGTSARRYRVAGLLRACRNNRLERCCLWRRALACGRFPSCVLGRAGPPSWTGPRVPRRCTGPQRIGSCRRFGLGPRRCRPYQETLLFSPGRQVNAPENQDVCRAAACAEGHLAGRAYRALPRAATLMR